MVGLVLFDVVVSQWSLEIGELVVHLSKERDVVVLEGQSGLRSGDLDGGEVCVDGHVCKRDSACVGSDLVEDDVQVVAFEKEDQEE